MKTFDLIELRKAIAADATNRCMKNAEENVYLSDYSTVRAL